MNTTDEQLIIKFYGHEDNDQLSPKELVEILLSTKMEVLIDIVKKYTPKRELKSFDIIQYSNLEDIFESVPEILKECPQEGVSFQQLGYYLRRGITRKGIADKKYGENHGKSAVLLNLCNLSKERPTLVGLSLFGNYYINLPKEKRLRLRPRISLYPFMVQQYFKEIENFISKDECLLSLMSFLSQSTQFRRLSNCRFLIEIIEKELIHEL